VVCKKDIHTIVQRCTVPMYVCELGEKMVSVRRCTALYFGCSSLSCGSCFVVVVWNHEALKENEKKNEMKKHDPSVGPDPHMRHGKIVADKVKKEYNTIKKERRRNKNCAQSVFPPPIRPT